MDGIRSAQAGVPRATAAITLELLPPCVEGVDGAVAGGGTEELRTVGGCAGEGGVVGVVEGREGRGGAGLGIDMGKGD